MSRSVAESARALSNTPADAAAVQLAKQYAAAIDASEAGRRAEVLERLGPKLLSALDALGATPRGRATTARPSTTPSSPVSPDAAGSALARLRDARRQ